MREILFRGKREDNGEWVYGYYVCDETGQISEEPIAFIYHLNNHPCGWDLIPFEVIPETVGQYTGLNDNTKWEQLTKKEQSNWLKNHTVEEWNGKRIFEGDIVNVNTHKNECHYKYIGRHLMIRFDEYHRFVASGRLEYPLCNHYEWEVIGNIHDNPELMEVQE